MALLNPGSFGSKFWMLDLFTFVNVILAWPAKPANCTGPPGPAACATPTMPLVTLAATTTVMIASVIRLIENLATVISFEDQIDGAPGFVLCI